jgi:Transposase
MHKKQNHVYVGLDLHKDTHTAVIIDCWDEKIDSITIENKPSDFTRLINKVNKIAGKLIPVYGLEDVNGYGRSLAVFLIERGMIVKEVNSALSFMERMSYPTTKKSDDWDANCIVSKKGTPRNPVFLEYYKRKVSEGKTKIQALVCVMRRLNNIIYGMMKNKTEYVLPIVEIKEVA